MIDEQTNLNTIQAVDSFHVMGDSCYKAERKMDSEQYVRHLYSALLNECVAIDECEFEDDNRYNTEAYTPEYVPVMPVQPTAVAAVNQPVPCNTVKTETVRVFNRKRVPWLVAYIVVTLVAILVLALTLPGTGWESKAGITSQDIISPKPAVAESTSTLLHTICLPDGTTQVVTLEPYTEPTVETNWFDEVCDWISGVIGG